LTGEQRHTDHIVNRQRVSRNKLPTLLCFNFFPNAQNILNCQPTNGTFGFAPTQSQPFRKTKRAVFPNALDYRNFYLDILNKCLLLPNKTTFAT